MEDSVTTMEVKKKIETEILSSWDIVSAICMFMCLCVTSQKAISDQDLYFELYCEEVNEPRLPICSTCGDFQHIITGGKKNHVYAFHCYAGITQ